MTDTQMPASAQTENIDWHEVEKFETLAAQWWDKSGQFKTLHDINPLRLDYIKRRLGGQLSGLSIVDVGCGGGILAESLREQGATVTGIDAGARNIGIAQAHAKQVNSQTEYLNLTAEQLAEERMEQFDAVCCMEMLEHVPDPAAVIAACAKLLKPGGKAFFSTINRTPKAYIFAVIGAEYVLRMLPKGTHEYAKFLRPDEIDMAADIVGLTLDHAIGMHYNPITQNYWLDRGLDVNYIVCYEKSIKAA